MNTLSDLGSALDNLYAVFSRYPLPAETAVCDHCVSPESVQAARAAPLRLLTASALQPYASHAISTWGDLEEFKHYLPRLLELLILEELDGLYADSVMRWVTFGWRSLRQAEQEAIMTVVNAWWRQTLLHYPRDVDVMSMIEIIADTLGLELAPYLAEWEALDPEAAARHMAWLVEDFTVHSGHDADWYANLEAWIAGPAPARMLTAGLVRAKSAEAAEQFSHALETHRSWHG
ncbi:hypothetical protein EDD27_9687 [Nonomuraea polychroma]|uniref:Uncharacterized protein n=1 Tax=Nonomuraea polychroma TaxID=46176 RepID=A0A438MM03_9ACTN|nr:hypothetical protein [Nonomuraea polychroma]RVX46784.1 hypothetical protein EDD27_9687 [Nonomuraea polychroma]